MHNLAAILGLTIGSSLFGLAGGFLLLWRADATKRLAHLLISFGAGGIIGATFLELLPEALHLSQDVEATLLYMLAGVVIFFTVEKLLLWHHHGHAHDTGEDPTHPSHLVNTAVRPLIIIGDALHNFLDGAVIAVAFLVDVRLGVITALAVFVHELPQEIGDFSILIHSGMKRGPLVMWNILGALVSPLGAITAYFAFEQLSSIQAPLLAFAAGNFIYIALADLLPSVQHQAKLRQSVLQIVLLLAGVGVIWTLGHLLPG